MRSRILAPALLLVTGVGLTLPPSIATAAAPKLVTHINSCWSTDRVPPVIDSLTVTPATVDTDSPATVTFTVQAHDVGGPGPASGVGKVEVDLLNTVGASVPSTLLTHRADGSWRGSAVVPTGSQGDLDAKVSAWDKSGDHKNSLQNGAPTVRLFPDVVQASNNIPPSGDHTPPTLTGLHLSTTMIDTRSRAKVVTIRATASDDDSGVAKIHVDFFPQFGHGRAYRVELTKVGSGGFRGKHRFQRNISKHHEGLGVDVTDQAGNTHPYGRGNLRKLGLPTRITILSGPLDTQGPRVVRVLKAGPTIDIRRHARSYPVRVQMADPEGVARVSMHLRGETSAVALHRVSGTRTRGVWAGRLHLARCSFGPATLPLHVGATDGRGISHGTFVRHVRLVSPDRTPPRAHGQWGSSPTVFRFSEPVHGISTTNVHVYDTNFDPLTGSWKCRQAKGPHSPRVSCRTGSVLRATFYPDVAGTHLGLVDWEPDQHLDVLDAHGNPFASESVSPDVLD